MNFLRSLLRFLLLLAALAVVAVLILLTPSAQTWLAERSLNRQPSVRASLGSFWMGFGKVQVEEARVERDGYVLTVPALEAALPTSRALWNRQLAVRSLTAKGWTLDLSRTQQAQTAAATTDSTPETSNSAASTASSSEPATATPSASAAPAPKAPPLGELWVSAVRTLLSQWQLPMDVSADGLELEGDVLVNPGPGAQPVALHTKIHGGGFSFGREGLLTLEAEAAFLDSDNVPVFYSVRGRIRAAMTSPRSVGAVALGADISARGGSLTADAVEFTVNVSRAAATPAVPTPAAGGERYLCEVLRGGDRVVSLALDYRQASQRLEGAWKVDLRERDAAALGPLLPFSGGDVAGEGSVDADVSLDRVHAEGRLHASGNRLALLSVPLERYGAHQLDLSFDAVRRRGGLHVDRAELRLAGERPVATARSLQAFEIDGKTGAVAPADPKADWLEASLLALPLDGLPPLPGALRLAGATAAGDVVVRAADGRFSLRSRTPFSASGVVLQQGDRTLFRGLELSLSLEGELGPRDWRLRAAPLRLSRAGASLVSAEVTATKAAGKDQPLTLQGTWTADLAAFAAETHAPLLQALAVRSGTGDLTLTLGPLTKAQGKAELAGTDTARHLAARFDIETDAYGSVVFHLPLTIAWGSQVSEIAADGTWTSPASGYPVNFRLSGKNAELDQLRWLAGPVGALYGTESPAAENRPDSGRDTVPFWGARPGQVMVALDQLQVGEDLLKEVHGTITLDPRGLQLKYGGYIAPDGNLTPVDGSVSFDPAAADPYALKLTFDPVTIDATPYFAAPRAGEDAEFHGKFSVTSTVVGSGKTLADLVGRTQSEYRLSSTNGIVRLLKTHVTLAGPEPTKALADTAGRVGSALGSFFGAKGLHDSGAVKVNPTTQAVFDLSYGVAEIGYKDLSFVARRGADGDVRISDLVMNGDHHRLVGSGKMTALKGKPLRAWPLEVELKLAAHDDIATILGKTGLPVSAKGEDGFIWLEQPFHFRGTLEHLDTAEWHDLLHKAAQKSEPAKK
ncbi:hypothetical protein DB347_07405 [Opitutaceae bacterium EW11]|nr:hypothetical protein DB347_07405 [Opitutaceae bacterium EW11]